MDRIYKNVWDKVRSGSLIKRVLFNFAIDYKRKWTSRGGDTPILNAIVMSSIKNLLGVCWCFSCTIDSRLGRSHD